MLDKQRDVASGNDTGGTHVENIGSRWIVLYMIGATSRLGWSVLGDKYCLVFLEVGFRCNERWNLPH